MQRDLMGPPLTDEDRERIRTACTRHTPQPEGYLQWHEWARRMVKTHKQLRCEGCGLWVVWEPKTKLHKKPTP